MYHVGESYYKCSRSGSDELCFNKKKNNLVLVPFDKENLHNLTNVSVNLFIIQVWVGSGSVTLVSTFDMTFSQAPVDFKFLEE